MGDGHAQWCAVPPAAALNTGLACRPIVSGMLRVCCLRRQCRPAVGGAGTCTLAARQAEMHTCLHGLLQVGHPQAPELVGAALKALSLW